MNFIYLECSRGSVFLPQKTQCLKQSFTTIYTLPDTTDRQQEYHQYVGITLVTRYTDKTDFETGTHSGPSQFDIRHANTRVMQ